MLKFKKNWLYRYNDWCDDNLWTIDDVTRSKTLCSYFWGSVWNLLVTNVLYVLITCAFGAIMGYSALSEGVIPFEGMVGIILHILSGWGLFLGFILSFVVAVYVWHFVGNFLGGKFKKSKEVKKNNIMVEWVKAKKNKICPLIEFED